MLGYLLALHIEYAQVVAWKQFVRKDFKVLGELRGRKLQLRLQDYRSTCFPTLLLYLTVFLELRIKVLPCSSKGLLGRNIETNGASIFFLQPPLNICKYF
jgi:hypothetical protein